MSATSALSMAASLPAAPMAIPTDAVARDGASFTPSPTIATGPYAASSSFNASTFSWGRRPAPHLVHPDVSSHTLCGGRVVPRQHHDRADTHFMESGHRRPGLISSPISE